MQRLNTPLALLAFLAFPAVAAAQYDPGQAPPRGAPDGYYQAQRLPPVGLSLSARLGYGAPTGRISDEGDGALHDLIDNKVPIWLELGYRFSPVLRGGIFFEYAPANVASDFCPTEFGNCDATDYRLGLDLQFHLAPFRPIDPWVGFGFGYEWLNAEAYSSAANDVVRFRYSGWELPLLEAGIDVAVLPGMTVGPYVSYSMGRYTDVWDSFSDTTSNISSQAYHGWLEVGVKGTFNL
jgi:hypothetical protein